MRRRRRPQLKNQRRTRQFNQQKRLLLFRQNQSHSLYVVLGLPTNIYRPMACVPHTEVQTTRGAGTTFTRTEVVSWGAQAGQQVNPRQTLARIPIQDCLLVRCVQNVLVSAEMYHPRVNHRPGLPDVFWLTMKAIQLIARNLQLNVYGDTMLQISELPRTVIPETFEEDNINVRTAQNSSHHLSQLCV